MSTETKALKPTSPEAQSLDAPPTASLSKVTRKPLRIWPISDLHLQPGEEWSADQLPDADVAVVAGDVTEGLVTAVEWLARHIRPSMPIVFVPGNHEFYGSLFHHALAMGKEAAARADIHLLDGDAVVIGDVRFVGATLWTDYCLFGEAFRLSSMAAARSDLNDHKSIAWSKQPWLRFRPEEAAVLHAQSRLAIESQLVQRHDGPTVVVTHHAPHIGGVEQCLRTNLISAAYASDLSVLIDRTGPDYWIHGHTHHATDARISNTRLLSNPRGYLGQRARSGWQPLLVVEV